MDDLYLMMNETSLGDWLVEGVKEDLRFHAISWLLTAGIIYGGYRLELLRAARAMRAGKFQGPSVIVQTTAYEPSGVINPETGREYKDQKIITEEVPIELSAIFDKKTRPQIAKYFEKAAKYCTQSEPTIYQHLDKIIKPKDQALVHNFISSQIINYFSALYNNTQPVLAHPLGEREIWEKNWIFPALVHEEGALQRQYRILLTPVSADGKPKPLPDFEDVRFRMPDGSYQHNLDSLQVDRYLTNEGIIAALENDPQLFHDYAVGIRTGNVITMPEPVLAKS